MDQIQSRIFGVGSDGKEERTEGFVRFLMAG
jgi:hypothetical protein